MAFGQKLLLVFFVMLLVSCNEQRIYEGNQSIENQEWFYEQAMPFQTEILDTSQRYNLFLNVRHNHDYSYSNLWLKIKTVFPDGSSTIVPVNIPMSDPEGKWYGKGLGSVLSNQIMIQKNAFLDQVGQYQFMIEQDMRVNPLTDVLDIGLRIEKMEEIK